MSDAPYVIAFAVLIIASVTGWAVWRDYKDAVGGK